MAGPEECPVAGCLAGRKAEHLMCWPHWRRVPRALQADVWGTAWNTDEGQEARDAAITAVEAKEASERA